MSRCVSLDAVQNIDSLTLESLCLLFTLKLRLNLPSEIYQAVLWSQALSPEFFKHKLWNFRPVMNVRLHQHFHIVKWRFEKFILLFHREFPYCCSFGQRAAPQRQSQSYPMKISTLKMKIVRAYIYYFFKNFWANLLYKKIFYFLFWADF